MPRSAQYTWRNTCLSYDKSKRIMSTIHAVTQHILCYIYMEIDNLKRFSKDSDYETKHLNGLRL